MQNTLFSLKAGFDILMVLYIEDSEKNGIKFAWIFNI